MNRKKKLKTPLYVECCTSKSYTSVWKSISQFLLILQALVTNVTPSIVEIHFTCKLRSVNHTRASDMNSPSRETETKWYIPKQTNRRCQEKQIIWWLKHTIFFSWEILLWWLQRMTRNLRNQVNRFFSLFFLYISLTFLETTEKLSTIQTGFHLCNEQICLSWFIVKIDRILLWRHC